MRKSIIAVILTELSTKLLPVGIIYFYTFLAWTLNLFGGIVTITSSVVTIDVLLSHVDFQIELVNREHKKVLEIGIENECLTNIMKNFNAKEHTGIISGKKKFDAVFDFISKKMASIKRHFFASPFEMMLEAAHHNCNSPDHRRVPNLSYRTREGKEKVWLTFERTKKIIQEISSPLTTGSHSKTGLSNSLPKSSCR